MSVFYFIIGGCLGCCLIPFYSNKYKSSNYFIFNLHELTKYIIIFNDIS